jgi:hypothetical protein
METTAAIPSDTSAAAERVQVELLRAETPARRFSLARSLSRQVIQLAWRGIRQARPGAKAAEVRRLFLEVHYGPGLAGRAWPVEERRWRLNAPDLLAALAPVVDALERLGRAYRIGGSVGSSTYGIARATLDIDVVADLRSGDELPLAEHLQDAYYVDAAVIREAIRRRSSFNIIHLGSMIKVDLFMVGSRPYDREAFSRVRRQALEEGEGAREYCFASPEDLVLNKLDWYRQGGGVSERQWRDVIGVLKVQAEALDLAYLRRWAADLGLEPLLERALAEARLPTMGG